MEPTKRPLFRAMSIRFLLLAQALLLAGCGGDSPTAVDKTPALSTPAPNEVTTRVQINFPFTDIKATDLKLASGIHEAKYNGELGAANLDTTVVQILSVLGPDNFPVLLAINVGRPAGDLTVNPASTSEVLVMLSPLLVSADMAEFRSRLAVVRASAKLPALVSAVNASIQANGSAWLGKDDPAISAAVAAVVVDVVPTLGISANSASASVPGPIGSVDKNGLVFSGATTSAGYQIKVENFRGRWVSVVARTTNDNQNYGTPIQAPLPIGNLIGSAQLINFGPSTTVNLGKNFTKGTVKVFGPGFADGSAVWADQDVAYVYAPIFATAILDVALPTLELFLGVKNISNPSIVEGSWASTWVELTSQCILGSNASFAEFAASSVAKTIVEAYFKPKSFYGYIKPIATCAWQQGMKSDVVIRGLLGSVGVSTSIGFVIGQIPIAKAGFLLWGAIDLGRTAGQITSSDALTVFQVTDKDVLPVGPSTINGRVVDALTSLPIAGVKIETNVVGGVVASSTITDASGNFSIVNLGPETYRLKATATGYKTNSAENVRIVVVQSGGTTRADFALPPTSASQRFGSISGRVTNASGAALTNADVTISGGTQTNGVFRATRTTADGTYSFSGVVMTDAAGSPLTTFQVRAFATGFVGGAQSVTLIENQTLTNIDFSLAPAPAATVYFQEGFETSTGWTASGFWHRSTLNGIINKAYPVYVSAPPGEVNPGSLPAPHGGTQSVWYGSDATGNFMGTQTSGDDPKSGGTSTTSNSGLLTSPTFLVPSGAPAAFLNFSTWFEIESVNPNSGGYDLMEIFVDDISAGTRTAMGRLNPFVDPTLPNRNPIPFTSGGFNQPPVWRPVEVNLAAFKGKQIRLVFSFLTVDALYNGFRGWIIDDVVVSSASSSSNVSNANLQFESRAISESAGNPKR